MDELNERWFPVRGYEGYYEISDKGHFRSVDRYDSRGVFFKGKPIKVRKDVFDGQVKYYARLSRHGRVRELSMSYLAHISIPKEFRGWYIDDREL